MKAAHSFAYVTTCSKKTKDIVFSKQIHAAPLKELPLMKQHVTDSTVSNVNTRNNRTQVGPGTFLFVYNFDELLFYGPFLAAHPPHESVKKHEDPFGGRFNAQVGP
jgi:hypothetical protein